MATNPKDLKCPPKKKIKLLTKKNCGCVDVSFVLAARHIATLRMTQLSYTCSVLTETLCLKTGFLHNSIN